MALETDFRDFGKRLPQPAQVSETDDSSNPKGIAAVGSSVGENRDGCLPPSRIPPAPEAGSATPRILTALAELPDRTLLDENALAAALNVTSRTVRRMVNRCELPPGIPFAGRSTWIAGKVLAHIEANAEKAARDADRRAAAVARAIA
jgi:hypothetical protein